MGRKRVHLFLGGGKVSHLMERRGGGRCEAATERRDDEEEPINICFSPPPFLLLPSQQRTLNKLPPELRCRNFVNNHQLSIQIGAKRAKTWRRCVRIPTELPFCIPQLPVGSFLLLLLSRNSPPSDSNFGGGKRQMHSGLKRRACPCLVEYLATSVPFQ